MPQISVQSLYTIRLNDDEYKLVTKLLGLTIGLEGVSPCTPEEVELAKYINTAFLSQQVAGFKQRLGQVDRKLQKVVNEGLDKTEIT
jgi:hypothetical protein